MKEVGLRGISNLALHPGQSESLKGQVPFLRDFLKNEARGTVQAVKSLRNIICHGKGEDTKVVFCSISKQLHPLINDVSTSKIQLVGDLLSQSFGFLKSPQSFLRAAAIDFTELTAKKLNRSQIHEDDVELLQNAIGSLRNDPVESIQALVNTPLKKIDEYVNPRSVSTSRISHLSNNIFKVTGMKTPKRKK
ncbi:uncharacterized protein LOC113921725 isoform X1 [Zalophus californianus]|uniref:Uncharacterized protein LOC113921725 isoform X1 n=1 Tax=Zalophus californianus TaxID=9704 RepID=A0A6J2D1A8_ZALCA|nr:uncharacterized protein LOC113921725 isoform X1 [Zalophus californianus]